MKWFFAYNQNNAYAHDNVYENAMKTAVNSAIVNAPNLEPHLLYDGEPSELTAWLESKGVKIINVRSCLYKLFEKLAKTTNYSLAVAAGTYLRVEVPRVCKELGYTDSHVLYTDCDIMVLGLDGIEDVKPNLFACSPEININDYVNFNAGIMLMNVDNMLTSFKEFEKWNHDKYPESINRLDQIGMQKFYGTKVEKLSPKYNWKPYWGYRDKVLVHFHGPKDKAIDILLGDSNEKAQLDPILKRLVEMCPIAYRKYRAKALEFEKQ